MELWKRKDFLTGFNAARGIAGPERREYEQQILKMAANARAWRAAHPEKTALVQVNFSKEIFPIAPISVAISKHWVSCNAEGLELVKALWPWGSPGEPTINMVRTALERHKPFKCPTCGCVMDGATCVTSASRPPEAGDVSLCIECGALMVFDENVELRAATAADMEKLGAEGRAIADKVQQMIRERP